MRSLLSLLFLIFAVAAEAAEPQRIVTIGGSVTETVFALGADAAIVGSDTTSYHPPAAADLPKVGYLRTLSAEGILSLDPDLVIMTDEAGPPPVLHQLAAVGVRLVVLPAARSVDDVIRNIEAIAETVDRRAAGDALVAAILSQAENLQRAAADGIPSLKIIFLLNHAGRTPMVAGRDTAAHEIMRLAGLENVVTGYEGYKPLTPEAAVTLAPDVILTTDRGLENAGGIDALLSTPGLSLTPAAARSAVVAMDALLLLGFGPRTVEAAETLRKRVQGE